MNLPTLTVLLNGTDITAYVLLVNGYSVSRGRADWQGAVTAGELSLTLNNSDGRFTPGSTTGGGSGFGIGPFGLGPFGSGTSSVAVDASIQLKETVNGVTYTRFTGYVKSWPISWPATVSTFATVNVTATDAQARAERRTLRPMVEEEILLRSPSAYYTLSEATGSTSAGDTSGVGSTPLTIAARSFAGTGTAPTFGTGVGPGADALPAAQFFAGKVLEARGATFVAAGATWSVGFAINIAAVPSGLPNALWLDDANLATTGNQLNFYIDTSGRVVCQLNAPGPLLPTITSTTSICDGRTHAVTATSNGTTLALYVDGVSVGTTPTVTFTLPLTRIAVGGPELDASGLAITATLSNVAIWPTALTAPAALAVGNAASGAAEAGTSRITRMASFAGLTVGTLDASLTTVPAQPTNGQGAMESIQAVSDAELGATYFDGTGALTFHNRNRVVAKTVPDLTLDHQYVTPDVQPTVDDQQIVNYFEATAQGTGSVQSVLNTASDTAHGRYPVSQTYLVQTDQEALDRANWIVADFAEPTVRYGTLTINLANMTQSQASTVIAAIDLDCWLRLTSMGSQTPGGTTVDVVVEGFQENVTADTWTIACNVVSHSLYAPVWVLGTSALGVDTRLYV